MPSERVQRVIDGYLDEIEVAVKGEDWNSILLIVANIRELDDTNTDVLPFEKLANTKIKASNQEAQTPIDSNQKTQKPRQRRKVEPPQKSIDSSQKVLPRNYRRKSFAALFFFIGLLIDIVSGQYFLWFLLPIASIFVIPLLYNLIDPETIHFSSRTQGQTRPSSVNSHYPSNGFKHPQSGYVEQISSAAWLWVLLFGPLYWAVKGVWSHAIIQLVLYFFVIGFLVHFIYPFFAHSILRNHYLKNGWREL